MTKVPAPQRLPGHSDPHIECPRCEQERVLAMEELILRSMPFSEAGDVWLARREPSLKRHTIRSYNCALKALKPFFGEIVVKDLHIGQVRGYQEYRRAKAGEWLINSEVGVLGMIMQEARCWKPIKELYRPLKVPKRRSGRSLTAEQEETLKQIAFSRKKWQLAAHCMMSMLSTTMSFDELRNLRRRDVDLEHKHVTVRNSSNNQYGDRRIQLNRVGHEAMSWIINRWEYLGGDRQDQFILPHRPRSVKGPWLFDESQGSIRSAFEAIRKEAGLRDFRVYDCRAQAISKLLSDPEVDVRTSREVAGRISQITLKRYQRVDSETAAMGALDAPAPPQTPQAAAVSPPAPYVLDSSIATEIARQVATALQGRRVRVIQKQEAGETPGPRLVPGSK